MFSARCLIQITQMTPQERWLRVVLHAARSATWFGAEGVAVDPVPGSEWVTRYLMAWQESFAWWGTYHIDLNNMGNYNYNITNEQTIWVYFPNHTRVDFVGGSAVSGGEPVTSRVISLYNAWMSGSGIDPIDTSGARSEGRRFGPPLGAEGPGECFAQAASAFFVPGAANRLWWTHDNSLISR